MAIERRQALPNRQRGNIAINVALMLPVLLGFIGLSIDIGRTLVVRNELQNAADAAALAGASQLNWGNLSSSWANASAAANQAVGLNGANGSMLSTGQVQTGYWNVTGSPAGMQSTSITPGTNDKPAVQVSISRSSGVNGGPIATFFSAFVGQTTIPVSAKAVAVISPPGAMKPGGLFPEAISQCLFQAYWNSTTGQPLIDPSTGKPYELQIGSSYHYGSCISGQWTSFATNANDVQTMRNLMSGGNPTTMSIGDNTWIEPGTKDTLYQSVPVPATVMLPVINGDLSGNTASAMPIVAFAPFQIDGTTGGSTKTIQGHFIAGFKAPNAGPGSGPAPYYGSYIPPVLAN
jgi:Flp pilus assembly protein TadG